MTTNELEHFDLASAGQAGERVAALAEVFPEVMREGKVDFDALWRSVGDWVDPGPERFGLTWPGKAECMRVIQEPSIDTLAPMPDESVDWDTTQNVIIEGENLEVLKLLQKAYYGKVKLIYIDPPYNTGKEFIYPDNFREGLNDYLRYSGQVDEEGLKLSANAETAGRYHSKWLSMMYPRLFMARSLLRPDGVIAISIDDHELRHLWTLLAELFGEENEIACLIWDKQHSQQQGLFKRYHEYVLIFARQAEVLGNIGGGEGEIIAGALKKVSKANPASDFAFPAGVRFELTFRMWRGPFTSPSLRLAQPGGFRPRPAAPAAP